MDLLNQIKEEMAATIRSYNAKGWSPATSTNYSFRLEHDEEIIYVSRSGIDKSLFSAADFITINCAGIPVGADEAATPSAETLIHCALYDLFPQTRVILHSHSVYPVLLSQTDKKLIEFEGFEIQKGFAGQTTHDAMIQIPNFDNTQDMVSFSEALKLRKHELGNHALIIQKHGTYAWGKNLFEAKRHLETLEYLCQVKWMTKNC